jgi:hypothetical protein
MKALCVIASLFLSFPAFAGTAQTFAPENDGWKEDCLFCESANMTQELFDRISDAGFKAAQEDVKAKGEYLTINKKWTDSTVNANAMRSFPQGGRVVINMYGGLARRPEVDARGFALVLSHELSHLYPVRANYWEGAEDLQVGSEGEADTSAAEKFFGRIAELVPEVRAGADFEPFVNEKCNDDEICKNNLVAGKQLANLLSALNRGSSLEFSDMATESVTKTIRKGYPRVQCRLTSYVFGALKLGTPSCWKASTDPQPVL